MSRSHISHHGEGNMNLDVKLEQVLLKIAELQPGYQPESLMQACDFRGEYELGVEAYEALEQPTPADDRWVAQCLMGCSKRERALEHCLRAIQRGEKAAQIDLVRIYIFVGRADEGRQQMTSLPVEEFEGYNRALWFRNMSQVLHGQGDVAGALQHVNQAWQQLQGCPEFPFLATRILSNLADLYIINGNQNKGMYYLERAEQFCLPIQSWRLKLTRACALIEVGRLEECETLAENILEGCTHPQILLTCHILLGEIAMMRMNAGLALQCFQTAEDIAEKAIFLNWQHLMLGYLASIHHFMKNETMAQLCIRKMPSLQNSALNQHIYLLRKAHVELEQDPQRAIQDLMQVLEFRQKNTDRFEWIRTLIHLSNALLYTRSPDLDVRLDELMQLYIQHDARYFCLDEWTFFPELRAYFDQKYPNFLPGVGKKINLLTIDREDVLLGGKIIKLPLKKTFELIVYLQFKGPSSLNAIITDVFGDTETERAKNYFHQIRHMLNQGESAFTIEFDRASRRYLLRSDHPIEWDAQKYMAADRKIDGILLPSSGSEWVMQLNAVLNA